MNEWCRAGGDAVILQGGQLVSARTAYSVHSVMFEDLVGAVLGMKRKKRRSHEPGSEVAARRSARLS